LRTADMAARRERGGSNGKGHWPTKHTKGHEKIELGHR